MNKRFFVERIVVYLGVLFLTLSLSNSVCAQVPTGKKIKVALVYTVTTPELKEDIVREVRTQLGPDVELIDYEVPTVFEDIRKTGYVTALPAARLIGTYMDAVEAGADAILSICSTVADIAFSMQDAARYLGVPIVMINDEMCGEAIRKGNRIAIMATFPTAIAPTKNTVLRLAREMGKHVEVTDVLLEGAFGLDQNTFKALMAERVGEFADEVDVILFVQGSMAYCEQYIADMFDKVVLSNPRFGAIALRKALVGKGLLSE